MKAGKRWGQPSNAHFTTDSLGGREARSRAGVDVYQVVLTRQAAKQLAALDRVPARRIQGAIELLGQNPYPPKALKLARRGGYRVLIGDNRLLYDVIDDQLIVQVLRLGSKQEVYR